MIKKNWNKFNKLLKQKNDILSIFLNVKKTRSIVDLIRFFDIGLLGFVKYKNLMEIKQILNIKKFYFYFFIKSINTSYKKIKTKLKFIKKKFIIRKSKSFIFIKVIKEIKK